MAAQINNYFLSRNYKALDIELNAQKALADQYHKLADENEKLAQEASQKADAYDIVNGDPNQETGLQIYNKITHMHQVFAVELETGASNISVQWAKPDVTAAPTVKNAVIQSVTTEKATSGYNISANLSSTEKFIISYKVNGTDKEKSYDLSKIVANVDSFTPANSGGVYGDITQCQALSEVIVTQTTWVKNYNADNASLGELLKDGEKQTGEILLNLEAQVPSQGTTCNVTVSFDIAEGNPKTVITQPIPEVVDSA